jgi:RimJ/RimL family protein N-acetyltransferase
MEVRLRPVEADDLPLLRRYALEPGLVGPHWYGFRDPEALERRFKTDTFLGPDDGRLMVSVDGEAAGFVGWRSQSYALTNYWNIGISLLPEWRGRGIGWRAQAMLCEYLFEHTPVARIEASTQVDNVAEQRALVKAGFSYEGRMRSAEFRAGAYRDVLVYGRLREDAAPEVGAGPPV